MSEEKEKEKAKNELSEEKLESISGGREEITIKPKDSNIWESYNPNSILDPNSSIIKP